MRSSHRHWLKKFNRFYRDLRRNVLWWRYPVIGLTCLACIGASLGISTSLANAQSNSVRQQEEQLIRQFTLPRTPARAPVVRPQPQRQPASTSAERRRSVRSNPGQGNPAAVRRSRTRPAAVAPRPAGNAAPQPEATAAVTPPVAPIPTSRYALAFNRSPVVGNRFQIKGIFGEARLGFTRPENWKMQSAKVLLRFQHSPALLANRSNLTVRVNGTSVGSVPLNRPQSQIGQAMFSVPISLLQNFNELSIVAQQHSSPTCTDPADPTLWTEILPDSKLLFEYVPQPIGLDFARYPYPFVDQLGLDGDELAYLRPREITDGWLTSVSRLQTSMGRLSNFRPMNASMVNTVDEVEDDEKLLIVGTPAQQPELANLDLPFPIVGGQVLDGNQAVLPGDVGVLMLAATPDGEIPVLIATGNDEAGVAKAVQFLLQAKDRKLGTGQALLVTSVEDIPSPDARDWPRYLPTADTFNLSDLQTDDGKNYEDITVEGAYPPAIRIPFRALPDDRFNRGSTVTLDYSYGPQINPRTGAIEVRLDGVAVGGEQLRSTKGGRGRVQLDLPPNLIKPNSVLEVQFIMPPREAAACGRVVDQQIWGTLHASSRFNLKRESAVRLPNLELLQTGFPLTAPQDLSNTAIVLPDSPTNTELTTLLEFSERMGRVSQADSVKLDAYQAGSLSSDVQNQRHLVAIGTRDRFPLPEVLEQGGFTLGEFFSRQDNQSQVQALPDEEGVVKSVLSPWNSDRVVVALTSQSEQGMEEVRAAFQNDPLFFQMQGDTMLISRNQDNPSIYDPDAYTVEFLQQAQQKEIDRSGLIGRASHFLQANWILLPTGIVLASLVLYGVSQLYLNRLSKSGGAK